MSKRFSSNKEVNRVIRLAVGAGWRVEKRGSNHICLFPVDEKLGFVTIPSSPSSKRNWKNGLSLLRSKGLDV